MLPLVLLAALLFSGRAAGLKCHKYAGQDDLMNSGVDNCDNASRGCYRVAGWKGESRATFWACNKKTNIQWNKHWYEGGCDCENAKYGIYVEVAEGETPKDVCYDDRHRADNWADPCQGASHIKGTACCCYGDNCNGADWPNRRRRLLVLLAPAVLLLLGR